MTSPASISFLHTQQSILENEMNVTKRNGQLETISFDKILRRIKSVGNEVGIKINYTALVIKVIDQLYDGISTTKIDELTAEQCASMSSIHYDYNILAGRILISNHQKNTSTSFSEVMSQLYHYNDKHGLHSPLVSKDLYDVVQSNADFFDDLCDYNRDYLIDYFGFKTLERSYLMRINRNIVERPQHMWLRVSIGIHGSDIDSVIETYQYMSQKYFIHATPTLFNAGMTRPQLSSCYLLSMESDSIDGIYNTLKDCALISKLAGGIGLHIHNVRATGSQIRGTNGTSNGIVPMLRVFNNTARYVDQCVAPETIIYTDEGPIQIQSCISGKTRIFNQTGQLETIQTVLEHFYEGEMFVISTEFSKSSLYITPEHPVYVIRSQSETPEWIEAKDLDKNDSIVYSVPQYQNDVQNISEDDCRFYAYFFIYGAIDFDKGDYILYTKMMSDTNCEFIINYLGTKLVQYTMKNECISWNPALHLPFRNGDFYGSNNEKRIHSRWLFLSLSKTDVLHYTFITEMNAIETDISSQLQFLKVRLHSKNPLFTSKIECIDTTTYSGLVYDLQMEHQHDYLLDTGLVHNGGGKRNGSFAIYLEPWHADIESFLQLRKNHGDEELKARDLFYALWIPDLFMERVKSNGKWTLMCPDECPGLSDVYGDAFVTLYEKYESNGKGRNTMNARDLWFRILDAQMETGTPYLLFKDAANKKSNQKNLGTIKSSNLCCEIIEYSDEKETAVCNLASLGLPTFVEDGVFNYDKLYDMTKIVTKNLNKIIDINYYPTEKTRRSNMRHRPIGIGVQGLADTFILLGVPFYSEDAKIINQHIFETIYYAALTASCDLSEKYGSYETFAGSPASEGILQFDLWSIDPGCSRYDWSALKNRIQKVGLRNSLLVAPMPTASTSQILGFNECIEPITSNIYSRRTLAGDFIQVNKYLMADLLALNLWTENVKNNIIANHGSIQQIEFIPQEIKDKFRTVWEIPMRHLIDMSADRGAFICQSQSLNLWLEDPTYSNLTSMHFHSWSKGLKTGIYYLRRRGKHQAQQFTIEPEKGVLSTNVEEEDTICEMCSA